MKKSCIGISRRRCGPSTATLASNTRSRVAGSECGSAKQRFPPSRHRETPARQNASASEGPPLKWRAGGFRSAAEASLARPRRPNRGLDFAQARHDLRAEKLNGTVPLVKPKPQIENDMIDADFEKFPDLIHDVLRTSGDEGTLQIFCRSKRTRSGLHPEFLLVGVREQSVEVDLFNGCLAVLVNARDRNAAFIQARPALSSSRAAKFFHAFAIGCHSNPAGQPAITVFHCAAYRGRCGSGVPNFKLRRVFGLETHVMKAIKLARPGSVIPVADFPQNRYLFAHDFVAGPLTHADGIKLLLKRSQSQA